MLAVAELAERQWGVVAADQLRALGLSKSATGRWLRTGRLRPMHRGVYAVGHRSLRSQGRWMAAVLACGPDAALSHASAAALWGIRSTTSALIEVTTPTARRQRDGLRVHRGRALTDDDVARHDGIPTTSLARTLLDLAAVLPLDDLESTVARALTRPDADGAALAGTIARGTGHRGLGRLATVIATEPRLTRSQLERRFLELVRRTGLPHPETNVWVTLGGGEEWQLDALWPRRKVSVELDSWTHHSDRRSFERDRLRAATLTAAGYRHMQFTWRQVTTDAETVARRLRRVLGG